MPELISSPIPQKTAAWLELTGAVYDIVQNCCIYIGSLESCLSFDFSSDKFLTIEL